MSRFELLIACIRSGQLSPKQLETELRNPTFRAYYNQRQGEYHGNRTSAETAQATAADR